MRKTPFQLQIEQVVTNGRFYQTIPYTRLLGQKMALKQWLLFSNYRAVNLANSKTDKTALADYLATAGNRIAGDIAGNYAATYVLTLKRLEEIRGLESRTA